MLSKISTALVVAAMMATPCFAQAQMQSSGAQGGVGNTTSLTGGGTNGVGGQGTYTTSTQQSCFLPTGLGQLAPGGGLPPTRLDSLVNMAGGQAELIYGDEGVDGPPPFYGFSGDMVIGSAPPFQSNNPTQGLTTGHVSNPQLPSAWLDTSGDFSGGGSSGVNIVPTVPTSQNPYPTPPANSWSLEYTGQ